MNNTDYATGPAAMFATKARQGQMICPICKQPGGPLPVRDGSLVSAEYAIVKGMHIPASHLQCIVDAEFLGVQA